MPGDPRRYGEEVPAGIQPYVPKEHGFELRVLVDIFKKVLCRLGQP